MSLAIDPSATLPALKPILNAMTVDVEDWFHILDVSTTPDFSTWNTLESRVERNVDTMLEILNSANVKATFFVLGWVAETKPHIPRRIHKAGHEIATHGHAHKLVYTETQKEFAEDLHRAKGLLEDLTGEAVLGYRAPGFSIMRDQLWALEILIEQGFKYDASVFPAKRGHGGAPGFPDYPYCWKDEQGRGLWEFPISMARVFGASLPFSGGGYLRFFPYSWIRRWFKQVNERGFPGVVYIHPREIDLKHPRIPMPMKRRFKSYFNLSSTEVKIRALLKDFPMTTIREILNLNLR